MSFRTLSVTRLLRSVWLWCGVVAIAALGLAGVAALGNAARRLAEHPAVSLAWGIAYLAIIVAAVWSHRRWMQHWSPQKFLWVTTGVAVAFRALLVLAGEGYHQLADRLFFLRFVEELGPSVWRPEIGAWLGQQHDYPLWTGRSWPQHLLLRNWFGVHHVFAQQMFNVLLAGALLPLGHALGRRLAGEAAARWTVLLLLLNPLQSFMVLDYTYQYEGALLLGLILWQALRFSDSDRWSGTQWMRNAAGTSVLLGLLSLQRGLDLLAVAILGTAWLFLWTKSSWRVWAVAACMGVAAPLLIARIAVAPINRHFAEHDQAHLYSHAVAQAGIGLNLATGGEFLDRLVQIDKVTPDTEAGVFLQRMAIAQVRDAPLETLVALPAIKSTKYLQIGAASGLEEGLQAGGELALERSFRISRVLYAPGLLLLAALGVWRLLRRDLTASGWTLVSALAGCIVIYAFLNQVSPRYSFYIQPALAAVAGAALVLRREPSARPIGREMAGHAVVLLLGYGFLLALAIPLFRGPAATKGFLRLAEPKGWVLGENGLAPWVRSLPATPAASTSPEFRLTIPLTATEAGLVRVTGYLWPSEGLTIRDVTGVDGLIVTNAQIDMAGPLFGRFSAEIDVPAGSSQATLRFAGLATRETTRLEVGYVFADVSRRSATTKTETPQGKLPTRSQ